MYLRLELFNWTTVVNVGPQQPNLALPLENFSAGSSNAKSNLSTMLSRLQQYVSPVKGSLLHNQPRMYESDVST